MRMNSPEGKSILALVRDGAFAHAGEAEAIELSLGEIPKDATRTVLDAGCGLGGTADHMAKNGWGKVTGFDIDATSIEVAKMRFPACTFVAADVADVGQLWHQEFDLICCFNSVYAFPDQEFALGQLAETARHGAALVIFEYTDPGRLYRDSAFARRDDAALWAPLHPAEVEGAAAAAGWRLASFKDITNDYVRWYEDLVKRIEKRREDVIAGFGEAAWAFAHSFYSDLRDAIAEGTLGGGIFTFVRED